MNKNIEDIYPLSPMQEGILFQTLYEPGSGMYFLQMSCVLKGKLNTNAFKQAWQAIVDKYSVFRTAFAWEGLEKPLQIVYRRVDLPWDERDWRNLSPKEQEEQLQGFLKRDRESGFDLTQVPVVRCSFFRLSEEAWQFTWSSHHVLMDGWCLSLIFTDVLGYYEELCRGEMKPLAQVAPYRDFIGWLQKQDLNKAEQYWRKSLKGFTSPTPIVRGQTIDGGGMEVGEVWKTLPVNIVKKLEALAREHHLTMNTIVQGAWAALLGRYCGEEDVVFGVTVSGRPAELAGVEKMVGLFTNTLAMRVKLEPGLEVLSWLSRLQEQQLEMQNYEYSPLLKVQEWSEVPQGTPLFDSTFAFQNYPVEESLNEQRKEVQVEVISFEEKASYPLILVVDVGSGLSGVIKYDKRRFTNQAIEQMAGHWAGLLTEIVNNPRQRLSELELISPEEREELLTGWNTKQVEYARERCLHEMFEAQAEQTPEAIAVVYGEEQLTYGQLNNKANQLAHHLRSLGVGPEVLVGLCVERSLELVVGVLGILKAGGAYVPLDPTYPLERLTFMLSDARVKVLVTQDGLRGLFGGYAGAVVCLAGADGVVEREPDHNPRVVMSAESLAYVIYTSGSTGQPKGALVSHYNVVRLFQATGQWFDFGSGDVWTLFHSHAFDFSVWELWGALLYGGRLVVVPYLVSRSPEAFHELLCREKVTVLNQTPSAFGQLAQAEERLGGDPALALRWVIFGGEALNVQSLQPWFERHGDRCPQLVNMYGITETTVHVTYRALNLGDVQGGSVIGRPMCDLQVYILDQQLRLVPVGVVGELYVGGAGLGRGYHERAGLTAERFIPDPFSRESGRRLYRTGDVGRYGRDGDIEYLGRLDQQVKIRGFRIELGEIENALGTHPLVQEALVMVREDEPGNKRLVGYVVGKAGVAVGAGELRSYLQGKVPEYMVPPAFVLLEQLPLTINGKVDRKALPVPERNRPDLEGDFIGAHSLTEELMVGIWEQVLSVSGIGVNDSFFDLGGHSLLAMLLVARVREVFGVELALRNLFEMPTVATLSEKVEEIRRSGLGWKTPPLVKVTRREEVPLSFAQERLWFQDQLTPGSWVYNIPSVRWLNGMLDAQSLEAAINEVVRRHEILRTTFRTGANGPQQTILSELNIKLPLVDFQALEEVLRGPEVERLIRDEYKQPFDLAAGPLFRAALLRLGTTDHLILYTFHHIVSDGWSTGVLFREVTTLYEAISKGQPSPLVELPIQYADFTIWQRGWMQGPTLQNQLSYWKQCLLGAPEILALPIDRPRPATPKDAAKILEFELMEDESKRLKQLSRQEGVTLFMTLLAAFNVFLHRYTRQTDLVIGSRIANRNRKELEPLIGCFVNTIVLRTDLSGDPTFLELLLRIKEITIGAYAHQDLPFDRLVQELQPKRGESRNLLFQTLFSLEHTSATPVNKRELELKAVGREFVPARVDLALYMTDCGRDFAGVLEYDEDLFDLWTIQKMVHSIKKILKAVGQHPRMQLSVLLQTIEDEEKEESAVQEEAFRKLSSDRLQAVRRKPTIKT